MSRKLEALDRRKARVRRALRAAASGDIGARLLRRLILAV